MRRWDQTDQNGLHKNDQWKILNKISPFGATFETFDFDFRKSIHRLSIFSTLNKNLSKVAPKGLILFRIFHWSFLWSPFWSIWSHLRINWQKLSKKSIFNCFFLETETFLGQTDTCVELVSKSSLKWAKVVFFEKITEWTQFDRQSKSKFSMSSQKSMISQKSMKYGLFCSEFSTDYFPGLGLLISGPTYA